MIELDDTLSKRLTGKQAVIQRAKVLLGLQPTDVPYYKVGLDQNLFNYGSPQEAIETALRGLHPVVTVDGNGQTRVVIADVNLSLSELIGEDEV